MKEIFFRVYLFHVCTESIRAADYQGVAVTILEWASTLRLLLLLLQERVFSTWLHSDEASRGEAVFWVGSIWNEIFEYLKSRKLPETWWRAKSVTIFRTLEFKIFLLSRVRFLGFLGLRKKRLKPSWTSSTAKILTLSSSEFNYINRFIKYNKGSWLSSILELFIITEVIFLKRNQARSFITGSDLYLPDRWEEKRSEERCGGFR